MKEPFIKEERFNPYATLSKETFLYLVERLKQLGFTNTKVKIPQVIIVNNTPPQNNEINVETKNTYTLNEFLGLEREFNGILLVASNKTHAEIKLLFINKANSTLVFHDDIFPLVKNNQYSKVYVTTDSPVTTYAYADFIIDFMNEHAQGRWLTYFLLVLLMIDIMAMLYTFTFVENPYKLWIMAFTVVLLIPLLLFIPQTGLHLVNKKRNLPSAIIELQKNWIVILISIIGTVVGEYLLGLLKH